MRLIFIISSMFMFVFINANAQKSLKKESKGVIIKEEIDKDGNRIVTRSINDGIDEDSDSNINFNIDIEDDNEVEINLAGLNKELNEEINELVEELNREFKDIDFRNSTICPSTCDKNIVVKFKDGKKKLKFGISMESVEDGVLITRIIDDTPADDSKLKEGDIILWMDNQRIYSTRGFSEHLKSYKDGETISVEVDRKGKTKKIDVKLR